MRSTLAALRMAALVAAVPVAASMAALPAAPALAGASHGATAPASASPGPAGPRAGSSSGCPAGFQTWVPQAAAIASEGARALVPPGLTALASTAADNPALKAIIALHPHWLSTIDCQLLEGQIGYVLGALQALAAHRVAWLDVRPEVQDAFSSWVQKASRASVWESGCHSWYTTASGRNTNNWPSHTFMYRYRVRHFDLAAYRVMPAASLAGAA